MDKPPDPRIAALAEALFKFTGEPWAEEEAAAILAALPPDCCGHDEHAVALARIDRWRKIEEAAWAVLVELDIIRAHYPSGGPYIVHIDTHADLRAALEAEG